MKSQSLLILVLTCSTIAFQQSYADSFSDHVDDLVDLVDLVDHLDEEELSGEKRSQSVSLNRPNQKEKLKRLEQELRTLQEKHQQQVATVQQLEKDHEELQHDHDRLKNERDYLKDRLTELSEVEFIIKNLQENYPQELENLQKLHEEYFVEIETREQALADRKEELKNKLFDKMREFSERSQKILKSA